MVPGEPRDRQHERLEQGPWLAAFIHDTRHDTLWKARRKGVIDAILIGDLDGIRAILSEHGEDEADYKLVECHDEREAAEMACQMVKDGEADFPMKGIMLSANFMRAPLYREP